MNLLAMHPRRWSTERPQIKVFIFIKKEKKNELIRVMVYDEDDTIDYDNETG